jgi:hypothetical protein
MFSDSPTVREIGDVGLAEHCTRPFQRMNRAEQPIDGVIVLGGFLDEKDDGLDFADQFVRLDTKGLLIQVGRIHDSSPGQPLSIQQTGERTPPHPGS